MVRAYIGTLIQMSGIVGGENNTSAAMRLFRVLAFCATGFLFLQLVSLYLDWQNQAVLGAVTIVAGLAAN